MAWNLTIAPTGRHAEKLKRLINHDPTPMLRDWGKVMVEDNRAGLLSGTQGDGSPMRPVTYRPARPSTRQTRFRSIASGKFGTTVGRFKGFAPAGNGYTLPNNNLTTYQYQQLIGPPGVPRRDESRLIANLVLREPYRRDTHTWVVEAFWKDVVDAQGRPFLKYLFASGRDARGVRPAGLKKIRTLLRQWARYWVKGGS